jgi:glycosyltransferase involved in cell wall biosynthesis
MKKKTIAFITLRRSHLIYMAEYINKTEDMQSILYTALPQSRCRALGYTGKVRSLAFPIAPLLFMIQKATIINPYKRSYLNFIVRRWFDKLVGFTLKSCDLLFAYNGQGTYASIAAHKKYNAKTICYQGSSHILIQNEVRSSYTSFKAPEESTKYMINHYENSDYLFAMSQYVANTDYMQQINKDKVRVLNLGVDTSTFKPTPKPSDDSYDVIMVGSWWKHKGCDMLMDACLRILKVKLLHVGSIIDCEIPDSPLFKHIDFVPESQLPQYYAQAKVFAMPSLDEGFGTVLVQAAQCGLPIVGSSRCGALDMKNLPGYQDSTFIVDEPLSSENIAKAISEALEYAKRMPDGLRQTISDNADYFSKKSASARLYSLIKEVIGKEN